MKNFIYFFKHKSINAVKIGRTSGESVLNRFADFKTYSPFGAEMLGFFECSNCILEERRIHERFKHARLTGEWFAITDEEAYNVINEFDSSYEHVKKLIIEYLSDPINDIQTLATHLKVLNNTSKKPGMPEMSIEQKRMYDLLPNEFSTKEAVKLATKNGIKDSTIKVFLGRKNGILVNKISRSFYKKILF